VWLKAIPRVTARALERSICTVRDHAGAMCVASMPCHVKRRCPKRKDGGRGTCASGQRHNAFLVRCRVTPSLPRRLVQYITLLPHTFSQKPRWFPSSPASELSLTLATTANGNESSNLSPSYHTMPTCLPLSGSNPTPRRQFSRGNHTRATHQLRIRGSAARILARAARAARAMGTVFVEEKGWTRGMVVGCGGVWER
jgi:hypothetical protein